MQSIKRIIFLRSSFVELVLPAVPDSCRLTTLLTSAICTASHVPNIMSKGVSKSSSFDKVLQSPFSVKDMMPGSNHSFPCQTKKLSTSSQKHKTRSSTGSRKLKRKRKSSNRRIPSVPSNTKKPHVSSSTSSSLLVRGGHTHSSNSLAKIDSPDPCVPRPLIRQTIPSTTFLQTIRQRNTEILKSNSISSTTSNNLPMKPRPSIATRSGTTMNVSLSRTLSSQSNSFTKPSTRSISRNPFCLKRTLPTCSAPSPGVKFSINELARGLKLAQFKNVVVMSGAGISTASGIPDFRTPGTGLYDNLQQYNIPEPSAIFDITFFVHNPRPFFTLAKELYPGKYPPNVAHYFIRLLQDKGLLLRHYTQNIDGLERLAGIKPGKLVESHGSFATASCTVCQSKHDPDVTRELIFQNKIPHCKHKLCKGMVKPDIVFFGEDLPHKFHALRYADLSQCDLLIVMGTSLEVEPFASLVSSTRYDVPRVLVNREIIGPFKLQRKRSKDINLTGEISDRVQELARMIGWLDELNRLISDRTGGSCSSSPVKSGANLCGRNKAELSSSVSSVATSSAVVGKSVSTCTTTSCDVTDVTSDMSRLSVKEK